MTKRAGLVLGGRRRAPKRTPKSRMYVRTAYLSCTFSTPRLPCRSVALARHTTPQGAGAPTSLLPNVDGNQSHGVNAILTTADGAGSKQGCVKPVTGSATKSGIVLDDKASMACAAKAGGRRAVTRTPVAPMLLLRAVPEPVMCQLVLAGWEQSSSKISIMS